MHEQTLKKTFRNDTNVELGKFTVVKPASANFTDGMAVPGAANDPVLGVLQESILPDNVMDYSGGQYNIVSGTAWPANSVPSSGSGLAATVQMSGISRCVASAAITRWDTVNIADNQGRVKTVSEAATTLINVVGKALEAATAAGDVIRVLLLCGTTYKN